MANESNFLVKFTKADYISIITENLIKAGFPHEFNDPFDSRFYLSAADIKSVAQEYGIPIDMVNFYIEQIESFQITSFTRTNPLEPGANLMWAHYGDSGRGLAILYDYKEVKDKYSGTLRAVNYVSNPEKSIDKRAALSSFIKFRLQHFTRISKDDEDIIENFHYNKDVAWKYENEYRIVTFGYISSINSIARKYNTIPWEIAKNFLSTKYLSYNALLELSTKFSIITDDIEASNLNPSGFVGLNGFNNRFTIDIPHYKSLLIPMPKPRKILLGWNVDKFKKSTVLKECENHKLSVSEIEIQSGIGYKEIILLE
jgi:hypothetical protein